MILRPFKWFYHEFGIVSIHETGRNAWLIILARSCRMFAYGTNNLILGMIFDVWLCVDLARGGARRGSLHQASTDILHSYS
jgi:hypothetical protein